MSNSLRKRFIPLACFFVLSTGMLCSTTRASSQGNMSAIQLQEALGPYQKFATLKVDFGQKKYLQKLAIEMKSQGTLEINRRSGKPSFRWKVTKPSALLVELKDGMLQIVSGEGDTQDIQKIPLSAAQGQNKGFSDLTAWLNLDIVVLARNYNVQKTGPRTFSFQSKEPESAPFRTIQITGSKAGYLEKMQLEERNGDSVVIEFDHVEIH